MMRFKRAEAHDILRAACMADLILVEAGARALAEWGDKDATRWRAAAQGEITRRARGAVLRKRAEMKS